MDKSGFYVYLQFKIAEHSTDKQMLKADVTNLFSRYHIPIKLREIMLKEMDAMNLVRLNGEMVRVINCKANTDWEVYKRLNNRVSKYRLFTEEAINTPLA